MVFMSQCLHHLKHECTALNPDQWQKLPLEISTENHYLVHKMPQIKFHVPLMAIHVTGTPNLKKKISVKEQFQVYLNLNPMLDLLFFSPGHSLGFAVQMKIRILKIPFRLSFKNQGS